MASKLLTPEQLRAALLDLAEFQEVYLSGPEGARELASASPVPLAAARVNGLTRVERRPPGERPGRLRSALARLVHPF